MYSFDEVKESGGKQWLKRAGLHTNAKFVSLTYTANEQWEAFDIELQTESGETFRERTFGPTIDKVYPKDKWDANGNKVGLETKEEALNRVNQEILKKLFYLGTCFMSKEELVEKVGKPRTFKELVDSTAKAIGEPETTINFLIVWKNSDARQKSNLIIAERIKWCEAYVEGKPATIRLTKWQQDNQMVEKYPYNSQQNESLLSSETIIADITSGEALADDLPF